MFSLLNLTSRTIMSNDREVIKAEDIHGLVEHFMSNSYKARDNDSKVSFCVMDDGLDLANNVETSMTRPLPYQEMISSSLCVWFDRF